MAGRLQYKGCIAMDDQDDKALLAICQEIPALEAIRQEALALAPGLVGDAEKIAKVWRGKDGLQHRIADALEPIGQVDAVRYNRLYDEVCKGVWEVLWAGIHNQPESTQEGI